MKPIRLTYHMAAILIMLDTETSAADNFIRSPLAYLASRGMVDIVGGIARITPFGEMHLPGARKIVSFNEARLNVPLKCRLVPGE